MIGNSSRHHIHQLLRSNLREIRGKLLIIDWKPKGLLYPIWNNLSLKLLIPLSWALVNCPNWIILIVNSRALGVHKVVLTTQGQTSRFLGPNKPKMKKAFNSQFTLVGKRIIVSKNLNRSMALNWIWDKRKKTWLNYAKQWMGLEKQVNILTLLRTGQRW
jgi:hypothetical protein